MMTYEQLTWFSTAELIDLARDYDNLNFEEWDDSDIIEFILDNQ